jgi:hypothetical protein
MITIIIIIIIIMIIITTTINYYHYYYYYYYYDDDDDNLDDRYPKSRASGSRAKAGSGRVLTAWPDLGRTSVGTMRR